MEVFYEWFRVLYEDTGINLPFIYDSYDRGRMLNGLWSTIKLSAICVFFSVIIGMIGAWLQGSPLEDDTSNSEWVYSTVPEHPAFGTTLLLLFCRWHFTTAH